MQFRLGYCSFVFGWPLASAELNMGVNHISSLPNKSITYTIANICNTEPPRNNKSWSSFAVVQQNLPGFHPLTCHVTPTEEWHTSVSKTILNEGPTCQATRPGMQIWKSIQLCLGLLYLAQDTQGWHPHHQTCFLALNKSVLLWWALNLNMHPLACLGRMFCS